MPDGGEQFVDVLQLGALGRPYHDVEIVVLGLPDVGAEGVAADVEIEVLIALVAAD